MAGPRIYNLFPLLAGPVPRWSDHLPRIAAMGYGQAFLKSIPPARRLNAPAELDAFFKTAAA